METTITELINTRKRLEILLAQAKKENSKSKDSKLGTAREITELTNNIIEINILISNTEKRA